MDEATHDAAASEHLEVLRGSDGQVHERRPWRDGRLHGVVEAFDDTGQPRRRESFVEGRLEGPAEDFDADGRLRQKAHFRAGLLDGQTTCYDAAGRLQQIIHYRSGRLHGEMTLFAPVEVPGNGPQSAGVRRLASMIYVEGDLHGTLRTYDELERPTFEVPYLAGQRQGLASWFHGGVLVRQATYVDDRLHGEVLDYHANGRVRERVPHQNDLPHGIAIRYHKNGNVKEKLRFHLGEQVGDSLQYDRRGLRFDRPRQGTR